MFNSNKNFRGGKRRGGSDNSLYSDLRLAERSQQEGEKTIKKLRENLETTESELEKEHQAYKTEKKRRRKMEDDIDELAIQKKKLVAQLETEQALAKCAEAKYECLKIDHDKQVQALTELDNFKLAFDTEKCKNRSLAETIDVLEKEKEALKDAQEKADCEYVKRERTMTHLLTLNRDQLDRTNLDLKTEKSKNQHLFAENTSLVNNGSALWEDVQNLVSTQHLIDIGKIFQQKKVALHDNAGLLSSLPTKEIHEKENN